MTSNCRLIFLFTFSIIFCIGRAQFPEDIVLMSKSEATNSAKPTKGPPSSRYKGVVPQQNGHWGAQIYAHHKRIWIGTFKTEVAAATAYDTAFLKLRPRNSGDPLRNFPESEVIEHERSFQDDYTDDQVLNMIKDDSYQTKFREYLASRSIFQEGTSQTNTKKEEGYLCQELFRKELTPSDVGKLNRLVIPKRYAQKHFPTNFEEEGKEGEEEGDDDKELAFYDKSMMKWSFRYCYWKSSKSFVFTRGWNKFVKEKGLKEKDILVFYLCETRQNKNNDNVDETRQNKNNDNVDETRQNKNNDNDNDNDNVDEEAKKYYMIEIVPRDVELRFGNTSESLNNPNEQKGRFRLFGVEIS